MDAPLGAIVEATVSCTWHSKKSIHNHGMATGRSELSPIQGNCRVEGGPKAGETAVELSRVAGVGGAGATAGGQHGAVGGGGERQASAACTQRV